MKLPRRKFLHLAAGAAALPALSRFAWAQAYPTRNGQYRHGERTKAAIAEQQIQWASI